MKFQHLTDYVLGALLGVIAVAGLGAVAWLMFTVLYLEQAVWW